MKNIVNKQSLNNHCSDVTPVVNQANLYQQVEAVGGRLLALLDILREVRRLSPIAAKPG